MSAWALEELAELDLDEDGDCYLCGAGPLLRLSLGESHVLVNRMTGDRIQVVKYVTVHYESCQWVQAMRELGRSFPDDQWPGPIIDVEAEEDEDPMARLMDPQTLASLRAWQRAQRDA